jgi:hypothetical protein
MEKREPIAVHVLPSVDGEFYVRIDGANGQATYRSTDGYTERNDARESFEWLVAQLEEGNYRVIVSDEDPPPKPEPDPEIERSNAAAARRTGEAEVPPPGPKPKRSRRKKAE